MAGSGYKLFASGEVLTAANLQGYAVDQSTMVFASSAARTTALAAPSEGMVSYLTDTNSVEIYDGSAWKRVVNTTGSVLQIVTATYSTATANNTNTFADTGLSASITPYSTSSKVLVFVNQTGSGKAAGNSGTTLEIRLLRGASVITEHGGIAYNATSQQVIVGTAAFMYLDSPATTSSTTYKTQFANSVNATGVIVQNNSGRANVSTIVLMEIAA